MSEETPHVPDFLNCPQCERQPAQVGHFIMGGRLAVPSAHGDRPFVLLVCIHSLPDERHDCPLLDYGFMIPEAVFEKTFTELHRDMREMRKLGKESLEFLSGLTNNLNEEEDE